MRGNRGRIIQSCAASRRRGTRRVIVVAQYPPRGTDGRSEREENGADGGLSDAVAGGMAEVEEERVGDDARAGHRGDESGLAETEREASRASRTSSSCAATLTAIS